jgi:predicted ATPase
VGVRTPVLAHDGRDLAAALQTIIENGDDEALRQAVDRAFPGSALLVGGSDGRFEVFMQTPGIDRPFDARELSDGTLRFFCLLAALMSPRPPSLLAFNEPETSIHPDLIDPLSELIVRCSRESQIWVTTHSERLAESIRMATNCAPLRLEKIDGETCRAGWSKYQFEAADDEEV